MKVMCKINDGFVKYLVIGGTYDVLGKDSKFYIIEDEMGIANGYEKDRFIEVEETNSIKPKHYNKGEIDLYESWYLTRPFNEFRAIMESVAERYMKRDKLDRLEDLDKCMETLRRLREYEVRHKEENDEV